ncbi:MAG: hypothetical protein IJI58_01610 [Bacilli bacterium]|nr:hypothetical protein [Bacilli bacterium]
MRDAFGGAINIYIIVVFIVFALGYMAFNVNYTKAFRMKDKIISVYEKYKGDCDSAHCEQEIIDYADQIGYQPDIIDCLSGESLRPSRDKLYCVKGVRIARGNPKPGQVDDMETKCYYHIVTRINISIPIIEAIFRTPGTDENGNRVDGATRIEAFYVSGDTKTITLSKDKKTC